MGIYYSSLAGYGILVRTSKVVGQEIITSCDHEARIEQKFCPTCGKYVNDYKQPVYDEQLEDIREALIESTIPNGYLVESLGDDDDILFIGWGSSIDREDVGVSKAMVVPPQEEIIEEIKQIISRVDGAAEYGVFEHAETSFGFYHLMIGR